MNRAPSFWWRARPSWQALALAPLGYVVGRVAARRMAKAPVTQLEVPVICVGNPTVGGAGKTPVSIALAGALAAAGARPVFLLRGFGGRTKGPLVIGEETADEIGDEAVLLARVAPTVVSADRSAGGMLAARLGDVVIMDDGFQNPALEKDMRCLLVDAAVGVGNAMVTPAGPLRAPLAEHWERADALVVVENGEPSGPPVETPHDLLRTSVRLEAFEVNPEPVRRHASLLAFAGIGRPEKFVASLKGLGRTVGSVRPFPDHHRYCEADAGAILEECADAGLLPATTVKDHVRLMAGGPHARRLARETLVFDVRAKLDEALIALAMRTVNRRISRFVTS